MLDLQRYNTDACAARRARLTELLPERVLMIPAGAAPPRNYPANHYPFRASSHFLYLVGLPLPGACFWSRGDERVVLLPRPGRDDALWHGPANSVEDLARHIGCDVHHADDPLSAPDGWAVDAVAALPAPDHGSLGRQTNNLERPLAPPTADDMALRRAMVALRLVHDRAALDGIRRAADATMAAHRIGMRSTRGAEWAFTVRAAMEGALMGRGMSTAYGSIVTPHGEVLHAERHDLGLLSGDLLLVDLGAETHDGWAADVTRTWPVDGRYSASQRAMVDVVLGAQRAAIDAIAPGVPFVDVHAAASRAIVEGLVGLGILRGDPAELFAEGAHAPFFPHGVGHLLGLDVHDMEDLGDLAGYPEGAERDPRFGWSALRLGRPLRAGMVVTIEPGFYQVPAILEDPARVAFLGDRLDREALRRFSGVRGIRIEDDVLVTDDGAEVLTGELPKRPDDVEAWMRG